MTALVIIDYGSGNLRSAAKACERAITEHGIKGSVTVSSDPKALASASHIILPGVGAFGDCMQGLQAIDGMLEALEQQVQQNNTWFLGICVGMQLLFDKGYEHGEHNGFGWISGEVKKFAVDQNLKIPHMGWNKLNIYPPRIRGGIKGGGSYSHPLCANVNENAYAYFVHSYHAQKVADEYIIATTDYDGPVIAIVGKDNIFGTQFHPEKSQATGLTLLANFLKL